MKRGKVTKLPNTPQTPQSFARIPRILWIIILLALSVRVIYFNQLKTLPFFAAPVGDEAAYHKTAQVILKGDLLAGSRIFYQDAFYPYYLAAIYTVFGEDPVAPKIFQLLLGILSCLLIYDSTRRIFGKRAAAAAGIISAVYPVFFFFEAQLLKSSLSVFFSLAMLWALLRYEEKPGRRMLFLAGISEGFSVIAQGHAYFFLPFVFWWLYMRDRSAAVTVRARPLAVFLLGTVLVIAPVTLRNYLVGKDLVLTTYQAGTNFYIGNNAHASGIYEPLKAGRELPPFEEIDAVEIAEQQSGRKLKPSEVSSYWFRQSAKFIAAQPAAYAALLGKKILLFMNREEVPDVVDYDFMRDRSFLFRIPFLNFGVLFSFAVAGVFLGWREKDRKTMLLYYCMLASAIAVVLFYIFSRYRLQAVPFVIMLAAYGAVRIADALQKRETKTAVTALCVCVPLLLLTARDMKLVAPGLGYGLMGHMAMEKGGFRHCT
jgi:4-amino-4-deoxy-L-arabinose transferase-like glycosyltransferase